MKGRLEQRLEPSNLNVMVPDFPATKTMKTSLTSTHQVMAINNGSMATISGPTPAKTISTTLSFDTGDRWNFCLIANQCATRCPDTPGRCLQEVEGQTAPSHEGNDATPAVLPTAPWCIHSSFSPTLDNADPKVPVEAS